MTDLTAVYDPQVGALFVISYMVIFGQLTSIELFIQERSLFVHEKTSGYYRTSAYFLAKVFCEIVPTRIIPTLFYAAISAYMIGLRTDPFHFLMYWLTLTATNLASTSLCMLVSSAVSVYSIGFLVAALFNVFFMISSGFLLSTSQIPAYMLPFKYLSIFRYNLENLLILELQGRTFRCPGPMEMMERPALCVPTGDMYLDAKEINPDNLYQNVIALMLMCPAYLFISYLLLRRLKKRS
jgi:ATP-binding cassette, subfamily G (WHITE), member 2